MELLAWYNLIFELPIVAVVFYVLLQSTGLGGDHDHDAHVDVGHDASLATVDHGIEHSVHHEHAIGHHEQEASALIKALTFLGLGRVPLSVLVTSFFVVWGFSGWAANQMLKEIMIFPAVYFWFSLGIASFAGVFLTRFLAVGLSRIMPTTETYGTSLAELVGRRGEASLSINERFGKAQIRDDSGQLHEVTCRMDTGQKSLPPGSRVILVSFDPGEAIFTVCPDPLAERSLLETTRHTGGV